jgi:drug/metabolite transporter (DMT)-like permease
LPATRGALSFFSPLAVTCGRIEIAAFLGIVTLVVTGRLRLPERQYWLGILWTGLGLAVGYPFFVAIALQHVPAAHGAVVIGLAPVATALLAVLRLGERPRLVFWLASIVGVGTVLFFALHQGGGAVSPADGWLVAAVASVGLAYVEGGRVSRALGGTVTLCWAMIALAPFAAIPMLWELSALDWSQPVGTAAWAGFWYAGIVSMFLGSVLWYRGLAVGGVARIGQLNLVQPLLTLFWSSLLLGEQVTRTTVLCTVIVLGAMLVCINSRVSVAVRVPATK